MEEIEDESLTADQVRQKLQDVERQYADIVFDLSGKDKSLSDCKTIEEVEEHVKIQFQMLKLRSMCAEYHLQLQYL